MRQSRTCVITINYHGAADTAACVASLLDSSVLLSIVVVDNTPNDPELEAALAAFHSVKLLRSPENIGFGRGNNLGIDWALNNTECEFIFIFNNDATAQPDSIEVLEQAMDEHPNAGVVAPRIVMAENPELLWYGGGEIDWRRGSAVAPGILQDANALLAIQARFVSFASGCAMLVRRSVINKVGAFNELFFMYEEDLEMCLRISESGYGIWYEPKSLVKHFGQGSTRDNHEFMSLWSPRNPKLSFYVYHIIRNRLINAMLHSRGKSLVTFITYFPALCMYKFLQFICFGRWDGVRALARGWSDFFRVWLYEKH